MCCRGSAWTAGFQTKRYWSKRPGLGRTSGTGTGYGWTGVSPPPMRVSSSSLSTHQYKPDGLLACIRVADFDRQHWRVRSHIPTIRAVTPSEREGKIIQPGDLLLEKSGGGEKQPVGTVVLYDCEQEATCSNFIQRLVVRDNFNPRYANFVHSTLYAQGINRRSIKQTTGIQNIDIYGYLSESVPVPPLEEQAAIVRFLDHADEQIQRYVAGKERLIALLEEERQALVHQAVTRGLDPSVKLKDSGMEEIGEIPESWLTSRVKHEFLSLNHVRVPLSSTERGAMKERTYDYYGASGVIDQVENYLFDDELLLIAEDGANLVLRNLPLAIIARGKFWVNNHAHILKPKTGNLEFLAAVMEGKDYLPWISGAAQPKLTQERLMNIPIAVPNSAMQDEIMDRIGPTANATESAISKARNQMDLMKEYRTRLIADVVTGQLDVRETAAQLQEAPSTAPSRTELRNE